MHCGRVQGQPRSRSLASRCPRRVLNYLHKLQGQRRAARVKAKRKATMFAHAVEKTTPRTRQEKRPASLRASVIARRFIAARKMLLASSELWVELWPPLPSRISLAPKAQHSLPSLGHCPRLPMTQRLRRYTDDPCVKGRGGKHAMRAARCSVRYP